MNLSIYLLTINPKKTTMNKLTKFNGISYEVPTDNAVKAACKKHIAVIQMMKKQIVNESINLQFKDLFTCPKQYDFIMDILRVQKLVALSTTIWIDTKKGNKGYMAALLRVIRSQGYYKSNINITNLQIQIIGFNTFKVKISMSQIKHSGIESVIIKYIPPASEHIFI